MVNVTDLPEPATHALYDEAMTRYAALVRSRAIGVYRLGRVRHPGISDIDLLVVTDRALLDNRWFFSAFGRLPERFHPFFRHEPYMLPVWSLRVMRYTTHAMPTLLAGRDVLHAFPPNDDVDERWCRLLESFCNYAQYRADVTAAGNVDARELFNIAGSLRYACADAAAVGIEAACESTLARIEELRGTFFEQAKPDAVVLDLMQTFDSAIDQFEAQIAEQLRLPAFDDLTSVARDLLRGERDCPQFDREYAFRRAQDIDGYNQELVSMQLPFGHLFSAAAHPQAVRSLPLMPMMQQVVANFYRVRRRLAEYART